MSYRPIAAAQVGCSQRAAIESSSVTSVRAGEIDWLPLTALEECARF
ncbi:hypothetical protein SJ05684_b47300 (plasmid) [Sinorhizobium sojae CCBAU 05684]|uniref:Uncharacterized protein n=1 Tax=Sinorhizobium sojae CCBAU 05684 TaxID=716928 RepID=A0A249PIZ8_9HYPH|nr:hypothetical protein SJ05684_b47300 [Sinorhizobium sojae CCBAU 05684]